MRGELGLMPRQTWADHVALICGTAYRTRLLVSEPSLWFEELGEQVNAGTGCFMASSFEMTRRVEFCETDMAGIVHFSNFYKWMEQAEHEFFRTQGLSIVRHLADGSTIGWPRVSAQCRFESPARYEDILTVLLTVQRVGMKSLTFDVVFRIGQRNVARGSMKTVCCLVRPGQELESMVIPDEYRSRFDEHPEEQTGL